jgi:hypothetical protein
MCSRFVAHEGWATTTGTVAEAITFFAVGMSTFTLAKPHGTSLLRPIYVRLFLDAMAQIGLYEQEG